MSNKANENIWNAIFTALGLTAVGLYFGLHALIWRVWIVISSLWVFVILLVGFDAYESKNMFSDSGFWGIMCIPPMLLYFIVRVIDWVISAIRDVND